MTCFNVWFALVLTSLTLLGVKVKGDGDPKLPSREELCDSYLTAEVLLPGTEAYAKARQLKNPAFDQKPAVIIKAKRAHDVMGALRLAKDNNLQVTVSSSGHDYIGRSRADNSVHIDMSEMTRIEINSNDPESDSGASAMIETAANWAKVYETAHEAGLLAIGGNAHTVTPGGYIQGGGHSPMGRMFGLGVDNTLGITMVTMDGDHVYIDASGVRPMDSSSTKTYDDTGDLFWALRGGGGGTFGVVLSYKFKLHKPPRAFTEFTMSFANYISSFGHIGKDVVKEVNQWFYENRNDNKIGGYLITDNIPVEIPGVPVEITGKILVISIYAGPWEEAWPVYKRLYEYGDQWSPVKNIRNVSTFWDYAKDTADESGIPVYIFNRFFQTDDLRKDGFAKLLSQDVAEHPYFLGCTSTLIGGKAKDFPDDSAAISSDFRAGAFATSCGTAWEKNTYEETKQAIIDSLGPYRKSFYQYGKGVYLNEPDYDLDNWKIEYWGSMAVYNRLLGIKQKWDPDNKLWCFHCVGSDLVAPPSAKIPTGTLVKTCHDFCVDGEEIDGDVWLPGSDYYNVARELKNPYFTVNPAFIVKVESIDDIKLALQYARENKVRPAILSSGHDYIGRSTCKNCVIIDMRGMTNITVNKNDPQSETGASAVIETAASWALVYEAVHNEGLLAVGGSAHTVTPGGYMQGGGHSPMGRILGLGVDNILGITMVTISGDLVYVHPTGVTPLEDDSKTYDDNGELFWALRGGGGGTFGVVVSFKVKLHSPPESFTSFALIAGMQNPYSGNIGKDVVQFINEWFYNNRNNQKLGGYLITNNAPVVIPVDIPGQEDIVINGTITLSSLYFGPYREAYKIYEPLQNYKPEWRMITTFTNYSTFWDYEKGVSDDGGIPVYIMNRFMQPADLLDPGLARVFTDDMLIQQVYIACTSTMIGGKSMEYSDSSAAINPAFRSGLYSSSCGTAWANPDDETESDYHVSAAKSYGRSFYRFGKGVYLNEPERDLENWKTDFWGSMDVYDKLLDVKKKWDPDNVLWCHNCVGSDLVDPTSDGMQNVRVVSHTNFTCKSDPIPDEPGDRHTAGTIVLTPTLITTLMVMLICTILQ